MTTMIDLSTLPPPGIVEMLDFEAILAALKADLLTRYPDFAATALESDPVTKLLEVGAYRELLLRQRVNDATRANLLAFAAGGDLDHLASFYGVTRLTGEADAALRTRIQQRIQGWANAGGAAHYRYWALTASPDVKDAAIDSPQPGRVRVSVLSKIGNGEADATLLDAVCATVTRDDVRVLTDTVDVVSATIKRVPVTAKVWLYPDTPGAVFDAIEAGFPAALDGARGLGWDLTRSWIIGRLQAAGVHKVELEAPLADVTAGPTECVALGDLDITMGGRNR